jgi:hypothetical protein
MEKPSPVGAERRRAALGERLEVVVERREHAELVAADAVRAAPVDGPRQRRAELVEQDVARAVAVAVVVGLEAVEVEQQEGVGRVRVQDSRQLDLEAAPVAQPGQRVGGGLDAAAGEQRVVLAQRRGHPRQHEPERRDGEADRDHVDVQRHGEREHRERERPEPDRDEQAAIGGVGSRAARGGRRESGGPGEAHHAGGDQGVGDDASGVAAQARHVDHIRRHERDDRGGQGPPEAIDPPAGEPDGADDRAEQHEIPDGIREVRRALPERRALRAIDRGGHRHAGEQCGDRKAADEAVDPRGPQRPADAAADQRDHGDVQARVDREPERLGGRWHRHRIEVRRQRVDDVAREVGEQPGGQCEPRDAIRPAPGGAGDAPDRGDEDDGVVHPTAEEVERPSAAEAAQRLRPDHHEQRTGEQPGDVSHRRSSGRRARGLRRSVSRSRAAPAARPARAPRRRSARAGRH